MPRTDHAATGRYLVLLRTDQPQEGAKRLAELAQVSITSLTDREPGKAAALEDHCALVFDHIGVALIRCTPDRLKPVTDAIAANDSAILTMEPGQEYSAIFETVAKRALAAGTLIVAAAGNDSSRPEKIAPVGHPANCPSIIAVAAIDRGLRVAAFSSGGLDENGGKVDIAAPGVEILSAWPEPEQYQTISGTSMAAPFVAGVAALYAEADPSARADHLVALLAREARHLEDPERDIGAGLVQAPQAAEKA